MCSTILNNAALPPPSAFKMCAFILNPTPVSFNRSGGPVKGVGPPLHVKQGCFTESARWEAASIPADPGLCFCPAGGRTSGAAGCSFCLTPAVSLLASTPESGLMQLQPARGGGGSSVQSFTRQKIVLMIFAEPLKTART